MKKPRRFRKWRRAKTEISTLITGIGRKNAEKSVREFLTANYGGARLLTSGSRGRSPHPNLF